MGDHHFDRVDLTLDRTDYLPRRIELHEKSGDVLVFEFLDLIRDVDLPVRVRLLTRIASEGEAGAPEKKDEP